MTAPKIPAWQLYGEASPFPDLLHIERIVDRAAGLGWAIAPHRHPHLHQLFFLRTGRIGLTVDGLATEPAPPFVLNLPPGVVHGFAFSAGTDGYVLTLPAKDHADLLSPASETGAAAARLALLPPPEGIGALFETLLQTWLGRAPFRRTSLRAQVALILCRALPPAAPETPGRDAPDPRLARFEALVAARLREHWPLERYAEALGLSPRHLSRLCQAGTGLSARAFIETELMHEACRLLAYTRMPVQEVAWALGYDDPSYFSRSFRRSAGLAPLDYRRRLGG